MINKISIHEKERLESLIGKEVSTGGICTTMDEYGVAYGSSPVASVKGILEEIKYSVENERLNSIVLKTEYGEKEISFNVRGGTHVWDLEKSIYHKCEKVFEASYKKL